MRRLSRQLPRPDVGRTRRRAEKLGHCIARPCERRVRSDVVFVPLGGIAGVVIAVCAYWWPGLQAAAGDGVVRISMDALDARGRSRQLHVTAVVFAGPSIYGLEKHLLAECRSAPAGRLRRHPARLPRAMSASIGLVDGVFESPRPCGTRKSCSPCPAESRFSAPPAWERCGRRNAVGFGMRGVGGIFEQYERPKDRGRRRRRPARTGRACLPAAHGGAGGCRGNARATDGPAIAGSRKRQRCSTRRPHCISRNAHGRACWTAQISPAQGGKPWSDSGCRSRQPESARRERADRQDHGFGPGSFAVPAIESDELSRTIYLDMLARRVLPEASAGDRG